MKIVFKKWEIKSCCCSKNTASAKSIYTHKKRMTEKIYNAYNYIIHIHTHTYTHLTSNRCISGLPCPIAMRFLSSESTFQALHLIFEISSNQNNAEAKVPS